MSSLNPSLSFVSFDDSGSSDDVPPPPPPPPPAEPNGRPPTAPLPVIPSASFFDDHEIPPARPAPYMNPLSSHQLHMNSDAPNHYDGDTYTFKLPAVGTPRQGHSALLETPTSAGSSRGGSNGFHHHNHHPVGIQQQQQHQQHTPRKNPSATNITSAYPNSLPVQSSIIDGSLYSPQSSTVGGASAGGAAPAPGTAAFFLQRQQQRSAVATAVPAAHTPASATSATTGAGPQQPPSMSLPQHSYISALPLASPSFNQHHSGTGPDTLPTSNYPSIGGIPTPLKPTPPSAVPSKSTSQTAKLHGSTGLRSQYFPDNPQHPRILQMVRVRSMQLYNSLYKTNRAFCHQPTPNPDLYSKLLLQSQMITSCLDRLEKRDKDKEKRGVGSAANTSSDSTLNSPSSSSRQTTPPVQISQAVKQYPEIVASCLASTDLANTIVMLLNSVFDLQHAHALDFDSATTIEAAYAYHHHKLEALQQLEDESRRKAITAMKDYLAVKHRDDGKKLEKAALAAFNALRSYEQDRKESCYQLANTDLEATRSVIKPLYVRLQSYYDYFQRGHELMRPFEGVLQQLKQICDDEDASFQSQLQEIVQEQDTHAHQLDIYLKKVGLEAVASGEVDTSGETSSSLGSGNTSNTGSGANGGKTATDGIRDLENRQTDKTIGTEKTGFLFTPPPHQARVWVELKNKVLRVSEEIQRQPGGQAPAGAAGGLTTLLASRHNNPTSNQSSNTNNTTGNSSNATGATSADPDYSGAGSNSLDTPFSGKFEGDLLSSIASSTQSAFKVIFEQPVMLLTAKAVRDSKYRFVFQFISPQGTCTLQGESDLIVREWLDVVQNAIGDDLKIENQKGASSTTRSTSQAGPSNGNDSTSGSRYTNSTNAPNSTGQSQSGSASTADHSNYDANRVLAELHTVPGNTVCCDCGSANPDWISINLGVLICLDCSGVHRQLGVNISKVRSVMMDKLDPHVIQYCSSVGNSLANSILLELFHHEKQKATNHNDPALFISPTSSRQDKTEHIRAKYQEKRWVMQDLLITTINRRILSPERITSLKTRLSTLLYNGVRQDSMASIYRAVICGADVTFALNENDNIPPLFESILYNAPQFLTCMLQFTDEYNFTDERGWCCLHYAAYVASLQMCEIVLSFAGSECSMLRDGEGKTPRDVAIAFNADVADFQAIMPQLLQVLQQAETKYQRRLAKNNQ